MPVCTRYVHGVRLAVPSGARLRKRQRGFAKSDQCGSKDLNLHSFEVDFESTVSAISPDPRPRGWGLLIASRCPSNFLARNGDIGIRTQIVRLRTERPNPWTIPSNGREGSRTLGLLVMSQTQEPCLLLCYKVRRVGHDPTTYRLKADYSARLS